MHFYRHKALAMARQHVQVPVRRRGTPSGTAVNGLDTTVKHPRRTTSGAAGNGLGTTIKYLRRTTNAAAGYSLGTTIKYLRRTESGAAGNGWEQRSSTCDAQRAPPRALPWELR